jgi:hypothetical protein
MAASSGILTVVGTLVAAFVGGAASVLLDRLWRRVESVPLFRLSLGHFVSVHEGKGLSLTIENVGLDPIPEYEVRLYHPDRGSLGVFRGDTENLVFPQYPQQKNAFRCVTRPLSGSDDQEVLRDWLHRIGDLEVAAPHFAKFMLRLVLRNSEEVLLEDEGLGNNIARLIYEHVTGQKTEQRIEDVYYRSNAPFWVGFVHKHRMKKMRRALEKEKGCRTTGST